MKHIKTIFFVVAFLVWFKTSSAQSPKPIYFLVDTINVQKENRIVETGIEGVWRYYSFYCRCISGYERNPTFLISTKEQQSVRADKPAFIYISWKDLSILINKEGKKFDDKYILNTVELLPNNEYLVSKTWLFIPELKQ